MTLSAGLFAAYVLFFGGALVLFALRDRLAPKQVTARDNGGPTATPSPVTASAPKAEGRAPMPAWARTAATGHSYPGAKRSLQTSGARGGASL